MLFAYNIQVANTPIVPAGTILHLSGIPGSGKTTYSQWLEKEKGFKHLEFDKLLTGRGNRDDLVLIQKVNLPKAFIDAVKLGGRPTVLDWGFRPYHDFDRVRAVSQEGVIPWWFEADVQAARNSFQRRGDVDIGMFEIQMSAVGSRWPEMQHLFNGRVIKALQADGSFLSAEEIFEQMFGHSSSIYQ